MRAFVFPGQGSQKVGMGQALADSYDEAKQVFDEADSALGFSLTKICWEGPEEELQLTANTQPAILATSVAVLRVLAKRGIEPDLVAGHSLGEYSALVAAGALPLETAIRLVRRRGELMQQAVAEGAGAMAAVLGLDDEATEKVAQEASAQGVCEVANYNAPGQVVIAGEVAAVARAADLAKEAGAKRVLSLPVSAPFHCSLMASARLGMTPLLEAAEISDPRIPVVCNVDARPVRSASEVRDALVRQIDGSVRWVQSVQALAELGAEEFVEVGPRFCPVRHDQTHPQGCASNIRVRARIPGETLG